MSRTVDSRVLEMQFDNRQFESNISATIASLEELKKSLNMTGASKGLENIGAASKNVDLSNISAGVAALENRFSTLGIVGMRVIENLTDSMMRLAGKTLNFLTSGVVQGGIRRAMNLEDAHFQLQGLLNDEKAVSAVMKNVSDSVDGTAYSLDSAAKVASQLAASGMRAGDKMYTSLRAVAGVAAMTNSSYDDIGRIFTQVAGQGRLMGNDLLSLASRGMNAAAVLGKHFNKTEGEIRDMVSKGQISFEMFAEAMDSAFGEHAKKANETFTGSIDNIRAALARIGAEFVSPLVKQNGALVKFFNALREQINSVKDNIIPLANIFTSFVEKIANSATKFTKNLDLTNHFKLFYNVIDILRNVFSGLFSVIKPIGQAFADIFPFSETLNKAISLTAFFKELTSKMKVSEKTANNLKRTFKGIFSVIGVVADFITALVKGLGSLLGSILGVGGGFTSVTAAIGDWLSALGESIRDANIFETVINGIVSVIKKAVSYIKDLGSVVDDIFSGIGSGMSSAFQNLNFDKILGGLNIGLMSGIMLAIKNFINQMSALVHNRAWTAFDSMLTNLKITLKSYEAQLNAKTLLQIAAAIGVLAMSLLVLSSIKPDKLGPSVAAMSALIVELSLALKALTGLISESAMGKVWLGIQSLISLSLAILILSSAVKKLSSIDTKGLAKGLVGIGALLLELGLFLDNTSFSMKIGPTATGILILSAALVVLSKAVKNLGSLKIEELAKGLGSIGVLLTAISIFLNHTESSKGIISTSIGMVIMASAIKILATAMQKFGSMKLTEIGKGLLSMGGALIIIAGAMHIMPKNLISTGVGLGAVALSMNVLAKAFANFGSMSWSGIAKGLVAMGGALAELSIGLHLMNGTLAGSAALMVASIALSAITPILKTLGGMSWTGIAKGLIALAGAFTVIGLAGYLLSGSIPAIIGLAGALTLLGLSAMAFGAGVALIGAGITSIAVGLGTLASAGESTIRSFVESIKTFVIGIADIIPEIVEIFGKLITAFAKVIGEAAPQLAESLLKIISETLKSLANYVPQIVDSLMKLFIGIINTIGNRLPELITAAVNLVGKFFSGIINALKDIDPSSLLKTIGAISLLTGLIFALSVITSAIPGALAGVLGMGVVVTELALVLAAIGGLSQIPGLEWLISEGGDFLQKIGAAIGKFVGGIAGGIASGITASLPQIGTDLSTFMTNLKPFIDGTKSIDSSMIEGVSTLSKMILAMTGVSLLSGITSFIAGGNTLTNFASQLIPFGNAMKAYSQTVAGIDASAITSSANAAQALSALANGLPNTGGLVSLFVGDNTLTSFATQLIPFGNAMKQYSLAIAGIDSNAIINSATAAKSLTQMTAYIPTEGGIKAWFTGETSISNFADKLPTLGEGLKGFSDSIKGINPGNVTATASAAKSLAQMTKTTPKDSSKLESFGINLVTFGKKLKKYFESTSDITSKSASTAKKAIESIKTSTSGLNANTLKQAAEGITRITKALRTMSGITANTTSGFVAAMNKLAMVNVNNIANTFSRSSSKLSNSARNMMNALSRGLKAGQSGVKTTVTGIANSISKTFSSKTSGMTKAGSTLVNALIKGMNSKKETVKSTAKSLSTKAKSGANEGKSGMKSAGKDLGDGLVSGINSKKKAAYNAGYALGQAAVQGEKDGQKSNSPSKLTIRAGGWLGEGLIIGMKRMGTAVYNAGSNMGESAVNSISSALSRVGTLLNSDMDIQPTIAPVMDLSNVEAGVGAIGGMFDRTMTIGANANINAISSMMNRRNQNGADDVVSAINKLRKDLGNIGGNSYQIGELKYEEGSDVAEAFKTIARAAIVERRK